MNDDEKIDFGPLDPSRDRARWAGLVDEIARRAAAARRPTILRQVVVWARPTLALAAALALVAWGAALLGGRGSSETASAAELLSRWAQSDEVPAASQILEVLGDGDAQE